MSQRLQPVQPLAEQPADRDQSRDRQFDFSKPFFNTETATAYTDRPSLAAFRRWASRKGIVPGHMGSRLMFARADLDRAMGFAHRRKVS